MHFTNVALQFIAEPPKESYISFRLVHFRVFSLLQNLHFQKFSSVHVVHISLEFYSVSLKLMCCTCALEFSPLAVVQFFTALDQITSIEPFIYPPASQVLQLLTRFSRKVLGKASIRYQHSLCKHIPESTKII